MALIAQNIPTQNFEFVKHRLAFILNDEIQNQLTLLNEGLEVSVFIDRKVPITNSESIVVDISLAEGDYSEFTQISSEGDYGYNINIYANTQSEDVNSSSLVDLIYGWILFILQSPIYKTLQFERGFVAGTYVRSFQSQGKFLIGDSDLFDVRTVRFGCRVYENSTVTQNEKLLYSYAEFKIDLTEKGYKVITNF